MEHEPAILVGGQLIVLTGAYIPDESDMITTLSSPAEDEQSLLEIVEGGAVYADQGMKFGENTITVTAPVEDTSKAFFHQEEDANERTEANATPDMATKQPEADATLHIATDLDMLSTRETNTIKQGEVLLNGRLTSTDRSSRVWPGKDGDLHFATNMDGREQSEMEMITLIPARKGKVRKLHKIQAAAQEKSAKEGRGDVVKKGITAWTPWGKRFDRRVMTAQKHAGEVAVTLDDQACVEVTVDGFCVLSRSGPYAWEWVNRFPRRRPKSTDYELHVVKNGMEVRKRGRKVWGVSIA